MFLFIINALKLSVSTHVNARWTDTSALLKDSFQSGKETTCPPEPADIIEVPLTLL